MTGIFVQYGPGSSAGVVVGWVEDGSGCHIWTGTRTLDGYGMAWANGKNRGAHRVRYEREVGPIPAGMELDHFLMPERCSKLCCNPAHVRPVTHRENGLRGSGISSESAAKTHCPRGHVLAGDNLVPFKIARGVRSCRTCKNAGDLASYHRRRHAILTPPVDL